MPTELADLIQTYWKKAQLAEPRRFTTCVPSTAKDLELSTFAEASMLMEPLCVACDDPAAERCSNCGEWYCRGCLARARDDLDRPLCQECADHLAGERIQLARHGVY